jgi:hypothetical protein
METFRRFGPKSVRKQTTPNAENPALPAVLGAEVRRQGFEPRTR